MMERKKPLYRDVNDVLSRYQHAAEFMSIDLKDVNQHGTFGDTPLGAATISNDIEAVMLLLEAGADVNARQENDYTPLHFAAERRYVDIAKLLLEKGASKTARNSDGRTPIDMARSVGAVGLLDLFEC